MGRKIKFGFIHFYIFLCVLATLCAVFYPAIHAYYAYADDFMALFASSQGTHQFHGILLATGRPGSLLAFTIMAKIAHCVSDFNIIRFLSVILVSICCWLWIFWSREFLMGSFYLAFLFSLVIFTSPPFQVLISWANEFSVVVPILAAILSAYSANAVPLQGKFYRPFLSVPTYISIFLLLFSISSYQCAGMFYWTMVGASIIMSKNQDWSEFKRKQLVFFSIGVFCMVVYGAFLNVTGAFYIQKVTGNYNPYVLESDYWNKLIWFLKCPLSDSLQWWQIFPPKKYSYIVGGFIFLSCLLALGKTMLRKGDSIVIIKQNIRQGVIKFALIILLIPLTDLPPILNRGDPNFFRVLSALFPFVITISMWALKEWITLFKDSIAKPIFTIVLMIMCYFGLYLANHNVLYYRVIPSTTTFCYYKEKLKELDFSRHRQIHVILPEVVRVLGPQILGDELSVVENNPSNLIRVAVWELGRKEEYEKNWPSITIGRETDPPEKNPSTFVINMMPLLARQK